MKRKMCYLLAALFSVMLCGCQTTIDEEINPAGAFDKLDSLQKYANEWGSITISSPLIAEIPKDDEFDLKLSGKELYDNVGLNGEVVVRKRASFNGDVEVKAIFDDITVAPAASEEVEKNKAKDDVGEFTEETKTNLDDSNISQRRRIRQAASDYMEQ